MPLSVYECVREFVSQCKCACAYPQSHAPTLFPLMPALSQDSLFQGIFVLLPVTLPTLTNSPARVPKMLGPLVIRRCAVVSTFRL